MYEVPKLAPFRTTILGELDVRSYGQQVNQPGDAADVFAQQLADDTMDLEDIIFRRVEFFASQILFQGKVRYRLDGNGYEEFSYGAGVPLTYDPPISWDNPAATPIRARTPGEARAIQKQTAVPTEATEPMKETQNAPTRTARR